MKVFYHFSVLGFSNTYLFGPEDGGDAVIVDPGVFDVDLLSLIENNGYYVRSVLITHNHDTHTRGVRTLKKVYNADIYCSLSTLCDFTCNRIRHGDTLDLSGIPVHVIALPGHSSDSMVFWTRNIIFTGDTLMSGTTGSTQNSYSRALLCNSIREKLFTLPDSTIVLPGHGPPSTIGAEKAFNPFLEEAL